MYFYIFLIYAISNTALYGMDQNQKDTENDFSSLTLGMEDDQGVVAFLDDPQHSIPEKLGHLLYVHEQAVFQQEYSNNSLIQAREVFVRQMNAYQKDIDSNCMIYTLGMHSSLKRYCLSHKNTKTMFLDDETLARIVPCIISKDLVEQIWDPFPLVFYSNPYLMNHLLYKYNLGKQKVCVKKECGVLVKVAIGLINLSRSVKNIFLEKEKKELKYSHMIPALINWGRKAEKYGFWVTDTAYQGSKVLYPGVDYQYLDFPHIQEITERDKINYLKTICKPQCYHSFDAVKDITSSDLKKRIVTLLCCLKQSKIRVPKPVLHVIFNNFSTYEHAQRVRPFILEQIELCKEYVHVLGDPKEVFKRSKYLKFICAGSLLIWFDKEA